MANQYLVTNNDTDILNKSNSTTRAVRVEANLSSDIHCRCTIIIADDIARKCLFMKMKVKVIDDNFRHTGNYQNL